MDLICKKLIFNLNFCRKLFGYKGFAYADVTKMVTKVENDFEELIPEKFGQLKQFKYDNVKLYPKFSITGRILK